MPQKDNWIYNFRMDESSFDVAVVGGGASGLVAAIEAAKRCKSVCILERNDRVGKKILLTGDGRCNLTNMNLDRSFYSSDSLVKVSTVLSKFGNLDAIRYFNKLGLLTRTLPDGRVFPYSMNASSVLDVLRYSLEEEGVKIITNFKVEKIALKGRSFQVYAGGRERFVSGKAVILSTGGASFPHTGSDGSAYEIAKQFGHTVKEPVPALVQLKFDSPYVKLLAGIRTEVKGKLFLKGEKVSEKTGEVLFTNYGATGPVIMAFGKYVSSAERGSDAYVVFDFLPGIDALNILKDFVNSNPHRYIGKLLTGIVHSRIARAALEESNIERSEKSSGSLSCQELENLAFVLCNFKMKVKGTLPLREAQVTSGGVLMKEVDGETLESLIVRNLYFSGEILNVDGQSGGYNLQWAWSSGYVAGSSAGERAGGLK